MSIHHIEGAERTAGPVANVKIESDGTSEGTFISARGPDGDWFPLRGCMSLAFSVSVDRRIATITIVNPTVNLTGALAESSEVPS